MDKGKKNSLSSLILKLGMLRITNGSVHSCLMCSTRGLVGLSDFSTAEQLEEYIRAVDIHTIHIRTNYGDWKVQLHNYDTYRFENKKGYKLLKIITYDGEIEIKI